MMSKKYYLLPILITAILAYATGCTNVVDPAASIYSMSYNAGAPISKSYEKTYIVLDMQSALQANTGTSVSVYNIAGFGQCSCGAETQQVYFVFDTLAGSVPYNPVAKSYLACDSSSNVYYSAKDSADYGNFGMKINGDEGEPYVRGFVKVDTLIKSISQIAVTFHGYVLDGGDTVLITNGSLTAPPQPSGNTGKIVLQ